MFETSRRRRPGRTHSLDLDFEASGGGGLPRSSATFLTHRARHPRGPSRRRRLMTALGLILLGGLLLTASCGLSRDTAATDSAANPARAAATGEDPGPREGAPGEGDEAQRGDPLAVVETLLKARHTDDLPDAQRWRSIEGAEAALLHHARHGKPLATRVRALNALAHFPGEAVRSLLVEVARRQEPPLSLRAAALRGLSGHLEGADAETLEVLINGAKDADPRVYGAAVESMGSSAALRPELERLAADESVSAEARALMRGALEAP